MTFVWGLGFAGHALGLLLVLERPANHTITPQHPANHTTTPPATGLDALDFDNNGLAI